MLVRRHSFSGACKQSVDGGQEDAAAMAVARAVIGRQRRRAAAAAPRPSRRPTHGRSRDPAEAHERHLRRIDDAEGGLDALLAEVGHRDRRIGELGAAQRAGAGARDEIAGAAASASRDPSCRRRAGPARPDRRRAARWRTPTWTARAGRKPPSIQKPFSSGTSRSASATALSSSTAGEQDRSVHRALLVLGAQPRQRRRSCRSLCDR